jgi:hypothetical protein
VDELEMLEKYEPVLRFAKSERFFPMAVEPYLERCVLFSSGPQGAIESVTHLGETVLEQMGKLESEQHYLRYVNNPLRDSDAWVWWGASSLMGGIGVWFLGGWDFVQIAAAMSLIAALIIFMVASPIRLRIIPAALASIIFIVLEGTPILFFLTPNERIGVAIEYLILLPIYLLVLFYLFVRTMKFIFDRIIPEGPGLMMDMLSRASERIAQESYSEYAKILEAQQEPVYYGRVVHETDKEKNEWTILQYHFFYAFNDWRLAANGMNHHEGDWEMVAVYLKNDKPYAVLFSQHGAGNIEKWDTTIKAIDKHGHETTHPVVYVALGSHANYSRPEIIRSPSMYRPGRVQKIMLRVDGWIHYIFMLINPNQKARQIALKEMQARGTSFLAEDAFIYMRDEADHYVVSLPMEIASGDGFRIGYQGDNLREGVVKSTSYIKRVMSDRKTSRPKVKEWRRVLLNPEPDWVQYKGLWGVRSWLKDESGPPGPKWDRPRRKQVGVKERKRWAQPLEWLEELETLAQLSGTLH